MLLLREVSGEDEEGRECVCVVFLEGLIVEQFCYKLGLILTQIAAWNQDQHTKVSRSCDYHVILSCDYHMITDITGSIRHTAVVL